MTRNDALETVAIIDRMLKAIMASVPSGAVRSSAASLRRIIGDTAANADAIISAAGMGAALAQCFKSAGAAGATFDGMDRVRKLMLAETPVSLAAVAVVQAGVNLALGQMVVAVSYITFTSRQDVDVCLSRVSAAFDAAQEVAANEMATGPFRALVAMHGACTRDLVDRARPLPRLVGYSMAITMPALALANRLYGDGSRSAELIAENKVVHPAFMPQTGNALAN